jgi:hypothetical protein
VPLVSSKSLLKAVILVVKLLILYIEIVDSLGELLCLCRTTNLYRSLYKAIYLLPITVSKC